MRVTHLLVLLAITFSIVTPFPLCVHPTISHGQVSIGTLDVCRVGFFALSTDRDTSCISEPLYHLCLQPQIAGAEIIGPTHSALITTFQEERPPKS